MIKGKKKGIIDPIGGKQKESSQVHGRARSKIPKTVQDGKIPFP